MNIVSNHNRLLRGAAIPTAGGDMWTSGLEYTQNGEISGYSGSAFYQQECPCDSAAIVDSAFNKSTAWTDEQNYLTAHQDVTNLPYVQNSALEVSPQGLISGISGSSLYATSAEGALNAETANFAYNAEHADSATSSYSALYANSASSALNAEIANIAYTALTANFLEGGWRYNENNNITGYNGSAFEANGTEYSAGANIDITNHVVSGKDWTTEIQNASSYAVDQATAQIPAVTGLPYVENSALAYTPGGHLVSSISGDALYAVSAEGAFNAETANYSYTAETANYVEGGWEFNTANQITGYSGSAFAATGGGTGKYIPYNTTDNYNNYHIEDSGIMWINWFGFGDFNGVEITPRSIIAMQGEPDGQNRTTVSGKQITLAYHYNNGSAVSSRVIDVNSDKLYSGSTEMLDLVSAGFTVQSRSAIWEQNHAGKIYTGIDPIVVDNVEDKISANTIPLSAGQGISITETNNKVVISCVNGGDLKFSNVLGGADLSNASAQVTLERVNEPSTINWYKLKLTNETGNTAAFSLVPSDIASGYLYCYGNGALGTLNPKESDIWVYAFDSATNSINVNKAGTYKEVHLSTPRNYDGYPEYTATIDGQIFVIESSCYCDLLRQDIEGTAKWCVKISGEYEW